MASHASSLACHKGDYTLVLQSDERIKEASRLCEIAQSVRRASFVPIIMQTL